MSRINIVLTALVVLPSVAAPQSVGMKFDDSAFMIQAVQGAPFTGVKSVQSISGAVRTYQVYRDSIGRTASVPAEVPVGYKASLREIVDPIGGYWYVVDDENRLVYRCKMPAQAIRSKSSKPQNDTVSSLGPLVLSGVSTEGTRAYLLDGSTVERWFSKELGLPILLRTVTMQGTMVTQITAITQNEPPPGTFAVPSAYSVVDKISPFVLK